MDAAVWDRISAALGGGDDAELWRLVGDDVLHDAERIFEALEPPPRQTVLTFARVPQRPHGPHPDDHADWRLSWSRERGERAWRNAGELPRMRRRRGLFWAAVCVPAGSRRLAAAEVTVLWRPRAPWAGPDETEIGRVVRTYLRSADDVWHLRGVREA